jgi:hypothetical protein
MRSVRGCLLGLGLLAAAAGCQGTLYSDPANPTEVERSTRSSPEPEESWTEDASVQPLSESNRAGERPGVVAVDLVLPGKVLLKLRAAPEQHADLVQLKLMSVAYETKLKNCALDLMVNGERIEIPKARYSETGVTTSLVSDIGRELVLELGAARQIGVRACERRWSLSQGQIQEVHDFVTRYETDLAWSRDPKKGTSGGLMAPVGGWPAWGEGDAMPKAAQGNGLEGEQLFKLVAPSVFQVEALLSSGVSQGSAVAVSASRLVTNCHVVQGARKIILKQKEMELVARIERSDPKSDRCVLAVSDTSLTPVRGVRPYADLNVGEAVFTLGAPSGLELSLSNGILSGLREESGRNYVQTTAPISPGSSGGGLFDARGNLVGVTTLSLVGKQRLNQSLNFALAAESFFGP